MEQPISTKKHVPTRKPTSSSKPLAKIQAYKNRSKIPIKDIQLPPKTMQLQEGIETLQHQVLDLKGHLVVLEDDKHTWEEEKWQMQERIDELNEYITPEDKSPTTLVIKNMSDMSLKDLEIT